MRGNGPKGAAAGGPARIAKLETDFGSAKKSLCLSRLYGSVLNCSVIIVI